MGRAARSSQTKLDELYDKLKDDDFADEGVCEATKARVKSVFDEVRSVCAEDKSVGPKNLNLFDRAARAAISNCKPGRRGSCLDAIDEACRALTR